MNKLCTLFISLMFSIAVFAQNHLEFRGIPIDGHINDFVRKMKAIGYVEKSQAVFDTKLEELTREVREHNNFAKRMPVVEEQVKIINHRINNLEKNK